MRPPKPNHPLENPMSIKTHIKAGFNPQPDPPGDHS